VEERPAGGSGVEGESAALKRPPRMVDRGHQQTEFLEAGADGSDEEREGFASDDWHGQPPPSPVLEALDRAAARLAELESRGMQLSLGVTPAGRARCRLRRRGRSREVALRRLLDFLSGETGSLARGRP
jgi:hypothetical protein